MYFKQLNRLKTAQIVLSAITTGGLIVTLLGQGPIATVLTTLASTVLLILTTYTKNLNLGGLAQKHADTASRLWNIHESYLSLLTDIATGVIGLDEIRQRRDALQAVLSTLACMEPGEGMAYYAHADSIVLTLISRLSVPG